MEVIQNLTDSLNIGGGESGFPSAIVILLVVGAIFASLIKRLVKLAVFILIAFVAYLAFSSGSDTSTPEPTPQSFGVHMIEVQ